MKKRSLTRAFSAAVATVLISSGLLVGAAATANAEPTPPQDKDVIQCLLSLDLANCLTGDSDLLGTGVVGEPLTLVEPLFNLLPGDLLGLLSTDITWLCDGVEIPGTAGLTELIPSESLVGCEVAVQTVTTLLGFIPLTLVTDLIGITGDEEPDPEDQLTPSVVPSISGANKVGGLLSIDPGKWLGGTDLVTPLFDYQWYNAAGPIPGAVGAKYVPKLADAGRPLAATVTAKLTGFLDGLGITNVVKVAKAKSKTKLSKAGGKRVSFKVGPKAAHPTGKVKLMKGAKVLKVYKLRAADNGKRIVRLPKLSKGVHKIRAAYKGNKALKGSKSKVLRVVLR